MKKVFAIVLAVCMVMSLAACDGGYERIVDNNSSNTTPVNNSANTTPADTTPSVSLDGPDWGKSNRTTYSNEYFNIQLTIPGSSWSFYSVDTENGMQALDQAKTTVAEVVAAKKNAYLCQCANPRTGDNISLAAVGGAKALASMTDNSMLTALAGTYQSQYDVRKSAVTQIDFMGETKYALIMEINNNGTDMGLEQILIRPEGDYYMIVTVVTVKEKLSDINSWFSRLE